MRKTFLVISAASLTIGQPVLADDAETEATPPQVYKQLMDCRAITADAERLACYDRRAEAFETATRTKEVVISDKAALKKARRGLFGFATPLAKLMGFGGNEDSDEEQVKEIETSVTAAGRNASGWRLDLADGSTWEQNDTRDFVLSPKPGNAVKITRGALGTYFVSVKGQRALKMRRVK